MEVNAGEMLALLPGAAPLAMQSAVVLGLHPELKQAPVAESVEPTLSARIQSQLVKAGIGTMQMITFITYILSLVTIAAIPLIGLFLYRKKRRNTLAEQERH